MSRISVAALAAALLFIADHAAAQNGAACGKREELMKHLENQFKETPVAIGLGQDGVVVEVLAEAKGSTWTIMLTYPNGKSCLVAAGEDWRAIPQVAALGTDI